MAKNFKEEFIDKVVMLSNSAVKKQEELVRNFNKMVRIPKKIWGKRGGSFEVSDYDTVIDLLLIKSFDDGRDSVFMCWCGCNEWEIKTNNSSVGYSKCIECHTCVYRNHGLYSNDNHFCSVECKGEFETKRTIANILRGV